MRRRALFETHAGAIAERDIIPAWLPEEQSRAKSIFERSNLSMMLPDTPRRLPAKTLLPDQMERSGSSSPRYHNDLS
jgi:hypothetical protein